jgi:hypothetical protein
MQEPIEGEDELREVTIEQSKLMEILAPGSHCLAEPADPHLSTVKMHADTKLVEPSPCLAENRITGQ